MNLHRLQRAAALALAAAMVFSVFAAPAVCKQAAVQALGLCGGALLVGVFPFLIVTELILYSGTAGLLGAPLRPVARLMGARHPQGAAVLLLGLAGGAVPAAAATAGLYRSGHIDRREAALLLLAAANGSPSFIVVGVGAGMLGSTAVGWRLFISQMAVSWLLAVLFARVLPRHEDSPAPAAPSAEASRGLSDAIGSAAPAYCRLCAYVIFFRVLSAAAGLLLPASLRWLPAVLLEMTGGCAEAAAVPVYGAYLCCAALSLQGLSILLQLRALCPRQISLAPLLAARPLHLVISLALFHLSLRVGGAADVYSSLRGRVIPMRRLPLECATLLLLLCLLLSGRLCRALGSRNCAELSLHSARPAL